MGSGLEFLCILAFIECFIPWDQMFDLVSQTIDLDAERLTVTRNR